MFDGFRHSVSVPDARAWFSSVACCQDNVSEVLTGQRRLPAASEKAAATESLGKKKKLLLCSKEHTQWINEKAHIFEAKAFRWVPHLPSWPPLLMPPLAIEWFFIIWVSMKEKWNSSIIVTKTSWYVLQDLGIYYGIWWMHYSWFTGSKSTFRLGSKMLAPCDSVLHELSSLMLQCCMPIRTAQVINKSGVWGWRCGNIDTSWWTPTGVIMIYSKWTTCWFNITGMLHEREPSAANILHSRLSGGKCQRFPAGKPVELQLK